MSLSTTTRVVLLWLIALHVVVASHDNPISQLMNRQWSTGPLSIPALSTKRLNTFLSQSMEEVSATLKKKRRFPLEETPPGFYYGIPPHVLEKPQKRRPSLSTVMSEALTELREMRQEMEALRREMINMQRRLGGSGNELLAEKEQVPDTPTTLLARRKRQKELERISSQVEKWAEHLLFEEGGEEDGWKEIGCSKMFRKKFSQGADTKCYLKWMKDSRESHAVPGDDREYPCIKCYSTLHAPVESVCAYLADESHVDEYNDLMVSNKDLEEITPHSKIVWGQAPQILFIKGRDFVTYCSHRWLRDGSQVVINQAVEHPDAPANNDEKSGKLCRARALRGANFISRDPDDPEKTRFALIGQADPGGIPQWATKTAINAVAPIEPFKLFHRIGENAKRITPPLEKTEMVNTLTGRSSRPAGLSQLGYACFWPSGGGPIEGVLHQGHPEHHEPSEEHLHDN